MNSLTIIIIFIFQFVKSSSSQFQNGNECEHILLSLFPEDFQPCSEIKYSDTSSFCRLEQFNILKSTQPLNFIYNGPSNHNMNNLIFDLEASIRNGYDYVIIAGEVWLRLEDLSLTSLQLLISTQKVNELFTSDLNYSFNFKEYMHIQGELWGIYNFNGLMRGSDSISIRVQIQFNQVELMMKSFKIYQTNQIDPMLVYYGEDNNQMIMCSDERFMFNQVLQQCLFNHGNRCEEGLLESATDHVCMFQCKQGEYVYSILEEYSLCILGHQICDQNELNGCEVCDKFGMICFRCSEGFTLFGNICIVEQQQNERERRILSSPFTGNCDRPQCIDCRNGYCYLCADPFVLFQGSCILCSRGIQIYGNRDYCRIKSGINGCANSLTWSEQCKGCLSAVSQYPTCGQHQNCANPQFDQADGTCDTCTIPHCLKCRTSIICEECESGYLFHIPDYYTTTQSVVCLLACPSGFNVDTDTGLSFNMCRPCPVNCETCDTNRVCTACFADYSLIASTCVLTTFYCPLNCLSCTTNSICDTCMSGFARKSDGQCIKCPAGCVTCTETQCTQCHDGSVSPDLTCPTLVCPQQYYIDKTCLNCIANCLTCTDGVSCTVCMPGYVQEMYMCTPCSANCAKCFDANTCQFCNNGYKLSGTYTCIADSAPIQAGKYYYSSTSSYLLCSSYLYCKNCTSPIGCTACSNGLTPSSGMCQNCLANQYLDPAAYECINCAVGCTTCSSSACSACSPTYQLSGGSCIKFSVCGDNNMVDQMYIGSTWVTKQCDDTNIIDGDGCSSTCQIESMYTCDRTSGSSVCTLHSSCGDGDFIKTMMSGLAKGCDDNNTNNGDGCSSVCQVETNYFCSNDLVNHISTCEIYSICGDHDFTRRQIVSSVLETKQCEDWNTMNGDGCDSNCRTETNYICTWNPTTLISDCVRHSVCGDGDFSVKQIRSGSYEAKLCDDLNTVSGDGCSSDCQIESNYTCVDSGGNTKNFCELYSVCGDGDKVHTMIESPGVRKSKQCDDGGNSDGDGCSSTCQIEPGFACIEDTTTHLDVCTRVSVCSDGDLVNPIYFGGSIVNKQCDDRNLVDNDGCSSSCMVESGFICTLDSTLSKSVCEKNPVQQNAFTLETKINPDTLNPMVVLRFSNILFKADSLRLRNLVDSQMAAFIKDQMTVQIEDTFADKYSYDVVMHDDQKGFNIEFKAYQNIINKKVTVTFLQKFQDSNNLSIPSFETAFPDTRPISAEEKSTSDQVADVGSAVATTFVGSVIPVILFANFSLLFNALDLFQMISYLKYVRPRLPYNMVEFLKMMGQFAVPFKLNFIRLFLELDPLTPLNVPSKYAEDSITGIYLESTGDSLSKLFVIAFIHFSLLSISKLIRRSSKQNLVVKANSMLEEKLNSSWKWGWYLNYFWEIYLRIIVGIALQFYGFEFASIQAILNGILFVASILVTLASPFLFARLLMKNEHSLDAQEFRTMWGMLYESLKIKDIARISPEKSRKEFPETQKQQSNINSDEEKDLFNRGGEESNKRQLKTDSPPQSKLRIDDLTNKELSPSQQSSCSQLKRESLEEIPEFESTDSKESRSSSNRFKYCKYFFLVLYMRKILFGFSIVFLYNFIKEQLVIITALNVIAAAFILIFKPYESAANNFKGFICEIFMMLATNTIFLLIDDENPNQDEGERQKIGWYFIIWCGAIVVVQIVYLLSNVSYQMMRVIQLYWKRTPEQKEDSKQQQQQQQPSARSPGNHQEFAKFPAGEKEAVIVIDQESQPKFSEMMEPSEQREPKQGRRSRLKFMTIAKQSSPNQVAEDLSIIPTSRVVLSKERNNNSEVNPLPPRRRITKPTNISPLY